MSSSSGPSLLAGCLAVLCAAALAVPAAAVRESELVVEILDRRGQLVSLPLPEQLQVEAGEDRLDTISVSPVGEWSVTILFDQLLSESRVLHDAALDLAELADQLVGLGSVEVVVGGDEMTRGLLPTRDAEALRQALTWLRVREVGDAGQKAVRRRFIRDFDVEELVARPYAAVSATASQKVAELRVGARQALQEEIRLVERQRQLLLEWALENRKDGPAVLVLVTGGDDDDPGFYLDLLDRMGVPEVGDLGVPAPEPDSGSMGRALAALGWVTVPYAPGVLEELGGLGKPSGSSDEEAVETVIQDGRVVDRTMLKGFDPRDVLRRRGAAAGDTVEARLLTPLATVEAMVEATGGYLASDRSGLAEVLGRLAQRLRVRVVDPSTSYDPRRLDIRYAGGYGAELAPPRFAGWLSAGTPEILAEVRARRLLVDGIEEGPLLVTAQAFRRGGVERVAVEIEPLEDASIPALEGALRLTVGTLQDGDRGLFKHAILSLEGEVRGLDGGGLALESDLLTPGALASPVVVLVEDLASGRWGGTYATVLGTAGAEELSQYLLPGSRPIRLLEISETIVVGQTLFETVHDSEVARVSFYLDGRLAAEVESAPFAARLDLGQLPEPHRVEVVAFDAAGKELGRDLLAINESGGLLRVRIVRPAAQTRPATELTGRVEVEAEIDSPRSVPVARVEFFWNEDLVATRFAPPYRQAIVVPPEAPRGFFRVVAHLEDGESAEDVLFINSPGGSERVRVELIQLFTVVTDRDGRPIQGLGADRFEVLEEGAPQEIATFSEAKDLPLTVGLAIDASASMFVKLPRVQKAAASFLGGLDGSKDRAFLVDFGAEPRLHQDTSRDLTAVEEALYELIPEGRTAIWKGIAFSLVQLQGIPGKKAVIVFSDGADEDPDFSFRTCLKFARRVGVPVYIIVSNDEIYRTGGRGLNVRGFINRLESLTRAVGGRVYFSRVGEDLESIYAQISSELRSQYVLGFYARDEGENRWRSVRVEVDAPGARARTVAGYFR